MFTQAHTGKLLGQSDPDFSSLLSFFLFIINFILDVVVLGEDELLSEQLFQPLLSLLLLVNPVLLDDMLLQEFKAGAGGSTPTQNAPLKQ